MPNTRLATRYAKALLDLAIEQGKLEEVFADMQLVKSTCTGSRELLNLLRSPIIKADAKNRVIIAVFATHLSPITNSFIHLLINKNREANLPEIVEAFINQYKEYKNIHDVTLITAIPVSGELKNTIVEHVKKETGYQNIELKEIVKPDLIGGFVLEVGDKMIDASIAYDLKQITKQFKNNDFIYQVR